MGHRLSITLGRGQGQVLKVIARKNRSSVAYVVRRALDEFIEEHRNHRVPMAFPDRQES